MRALRRHCIHFEEIDRSVGGAGRRKITLHLGAPLLPPLGAALAFGDARTASAILSGSLSDQLFSQKGDYRIGAVLVWLAANWRDGLLDWFAGSPTIGSDQIGTREFARQRIDERLHDRARRPRCQGALLDHVACRSSCGGPRGPSPA
jgi:hypothetical protein